MVTLVLILSVWCFDYSEFACVVGSGIDLFGVLADCFLIYFQAAVFGCSMLDFGVSIVVVVCFVFSYGVMTLP